MRRRLLSFGVPLMLALSLAPIRPGQAEMNPLADPAHRAMLERLRASVDVLVSFEGRGAGSPALEKAGQWVRDALHDAGLEPAFQGSFEQAFDAKADGHSYRFVNIGGVLRGTDPAAGAIVIGAHYDHLGRDASGAVYPGADDNASGVAVLVEIARALRAQGEHRRDIVFLGFAGEELGTLGSLHYVSAPARPLGSTMAMLNLDAVGRMDGRKLYVFGAGSALEWSEIVKSVNLSAGFDLGMPEEGPFASDQVPFFERGIPVLHLCTGPNVDYHRATDTADKLNYAEMASIVDFSAELAGFLADRPERLSFVPKGARKAEPAMASGSPRRVSLGTIPDFARESGGVLLTGVMPGSPAEAAGFLKGDIVVALGDAPIDNLADLSAALKSHQPGDTVRVVAQRGTERLERRVGLVERK